MVERNDYIEYLTEISKTFDSPVAKDALEDIFIMFGDTNENPQYDDFVDIFNKIRDVIHTEIDYQSWLNGNE